MIYRASLLLLCLQLAACGTQLKVAKVDPKTGHLQSEVGTVTAATIVTAKRTSLAPFKATAFASGGDYAVEQLRALNFFGEVLSYDDLQKVVVANNLQEKVPTLNEPIGLSKLYRAYKPFLWVHFKVVQRENKRYQQLIATNPENLEELFVAEIYLDFMWAGVKDQNSRYPLVNALLDWLRENP